MGAGGLAPAPSRQPRALDAYFDHGRVAPGTFDHLVDEAAGRWIDHTATGHSIAVVAETTEHIDALNLAIQQRRRDLGHLGGSSKKMASGETAAVGDIVVIRRNDRALRTDRGEPVRNRWTVTGVDRDGSVTVTHDRRHGTGTLPADYARE